MRQDISRKCCLKTLVSRYEHHFMPSRKLEEDSALEKMIISENGPTLYDADYLLDQAMSRYWAENRANGK